MEVSTSAYEFAHGHKPQGRGYWAFLFDDSSEPWWAEVIRRDEHGPYRATCLPYSEAKRVALKEAKRRKASTVSVAT